MPLESPIVLAHLGYVIRAEDSDPWLLAGALQGLASSSLGIGYAACAAALGAAAAAAAEVNPDCTAEEARILANGCSFNVHPLNDCITALTP